MGLERGGSVFVSVSGEVVENDCRSGGDFRDQNLPDICRECGPIQRPLYDPRRDQSLMGQPGNQGLGSPTAERGVRDQPLATSAQTAQTGEVCLHRRFIKEDNTFRQLSDGGQPMSKPVFALTPYFGTATLGGNQRLFL